MDPLVVGITYPSGLSDIGDVLLQRHECAKSKGKRNGRRWFEEGAKATLIAPPWHSLTVYSLNSFNYTGL